MEKIFMTSKYFNEFFVLCEEYERLNRKGGVSRLQQFFAVQKLIEVALAEGRSVRAIWTVLSREGTFTGTYDCLLRYIGAYIKNSPQKNTETAHLAPSPLIASSASPSAQPAPSSELTSSSAAKWTPATCPKEFNYNAVISNDMRQFLFGPEEDKEKTGIPEKS